MWQTTLKQRFWLVLCGAAILSAATFTIVAYSFEQKSLHLYDAERSRDIPILWSRTGLTQLKSSFGLGSPVAIINHGNTVSHSEYNFAGRVIAEQGYLVVSIQHDLPVDPPLSQSGEPFVGRLPLYERGEKNIEFVLQNLKSRFPQADFGNLTMVGGGTTSRSCWW